MPQPRFDPRMSAIAVALWFAAFLLVHDHAIAQGNPQTPSLQMQPPASAPQPPAAAPQPAQPAPQQAPKKDGFFDALGRWWDKSAAEWDAGMKKLKSSIDETNERNAKAAADATRDAVTATKGATDALVKFPTTRIMEGRERCLLAPNGSPDCGAAAEKICKGKGFTSGSSANIETARKCSARALLNRNEEECVNETVVTRAACQ